MKSKGISMLHRLLGKERTREVRREWSRLSPDFARFVTDFLAGEIWSRPHLELKTRSLITIAALAALGRANGLRLNIEMALNNGATWEEILETLLQMAPYAGFPACWEGLIIADQVIKRKRSRPRRLGSRSV
jgi:alkylhydroperoxidase/carboxymuconolactone decarboxylase family protein YurZ